eukprot:scaffold102859_cov23-Tisochrysis_lutea.AAC.2
MLVPASRASAELPAPNDLAVSLAAVVSAKRSLDSRSTRIIPSAGRASGGASPTPKPLEPAASSPT